MQLAKQVRFEKIQLFLKTSVFSTLGIFSRDNLVTYSEFSELLAAVCDKK